MPNVRSTSLPTPYREWIPPEGLAHAVSCVWTRGTIPEGNAGPRMIVPDNCLDLIWILDRDGLGREAVVVGPMSRPLTIADDSTDQYVGVRFRPGYAAVVLRQHAGELRDTRVDLADVLPGAQGWLDGPEGLSIGALGHRLQRALGGSLPMTAGPPPALRHALHVLDRSHGAVPVESLARTVGISRQHLARIFETHIGLRPKFVARVVRLQHVMALAARASCVASARGTGLAARLSWSALALEAGYTDQPHLIADFVSLTGATPAQWLADR